MTECVADGETSADSMQLSEVVGLHAHGRTDATPNQKAGHKLPSGCIVYWIAFVIALSQISLRAATFQIADGDVQSLITALIIANTNSQPDIINLATNGIYSLTIVNNTTDGLNGLPSIVNDGSANGILINGNGSVLQREPPSFPPGLGLLRILHIADGGILEMNRTTIRNGFAIAPGAGIFNRGRIVLNECTVSGNRTVKIAGFIGGPFAGGGIFNAGIVTVNESMILNNSVFAGTENSAGVSAADALGGGIYNA